MFGYKVGGSVFERVERYKYLGVTITRVYWLGCAHYYDGKQETLDLASPLEIGIKRNQITNIQNARYNTVRVHFLITGPLHK